MTLRRTWLVQRLQKPQSFVNPFNFGGGLRNGGLSDDAMSLLKGIFSFDYMGAAEYEFGDVPKAFNRIAGYASEDSLIAFEVRMLMSKVEADFRDKTKPEHGAKATVYVIGRKDLQAEISKRIQEMAEGKVPTKGGHRLNSMLRPFHEWDSENIGGLEMANDFIFFTDREAWVKTAELFGLPVTVDA